MAELLANFVPSQAIWRLRDPQGRQLTEVTAMIAEAESAVDAARRRDCHRHVGDFTLFWTGVYPEALAKLRVTGSADALISYQEQGKRSICLLKDHTFQQGICLIHIRLLPHTHDRLLKSAMKNPVAYRA